MSADILSRRGVATRYRGMRRCEEGHWSAKFDLIVLGHVIEYAVELHFPQEDRKAADVYFDPPELQEWIESDHALLHAVGVEVWRQYTEREGER